MQSWDALSAVASALTWPCATYLAASACLAQPPLQATLCAVTPPSPGPSPTACTMPLTAVTLTPIQSQQAEVQDGCVAAAQTLAAFLGAINFTQPFRWGEGGEQNGCLYPSS